MLKEIVLRPLDELKPSEYNPRKINAKQKEDIKQSLKDFGMVIPLVVNVHPDRLNIVVGGNQRMRIMAELGYTMANTVEVNLPYDKEVELNLRLNKNQGSFDDDLLNMIADREKLIELGWAEKELKMKESDYEREVANITNADAVMPVVPKFSEKYDSIVIFSDNELDYNWMKNVLKIASKKDYKNTRVGECRVLTVKQFQELWEAKND